MCIPCVMCGACIDSNNAENLEEGVCYSCGAKVPDDAISCPNCYSFLYRASKGSVRDQVQENCPELH